MKVEWLGDDLKLLGKLPKAVSERSPRRERPAVIVGPGALACRRPGRGAGAGRAARPDQGRLERLQRPPHLRLADGVAGARLCAAGRARRHRGGGAGARAAARRRRGRGRPASSGAFKVYIGHHGDKGAQQADLVLPGAAYAEKHGTYVNTEGRVQRGEKAAFPPGEAREDWAILRACRELARQAAAVRQLRPAARGNGRRISAARPRRPDRPAMVAAQARRQGAKGPIRYPIGDFFLTNAICRASPTHARCSEELVQGASHFEEAAE